MQNLPCWHSERFQQTRFLSAISGHMIGTLFEPLCAPLFLSLDMPFGHVGHSFTALLLLNTFSLLPDVMTDQSMVSTKHSAGFFSIRTEPRRIFNSDFRPISYKRQSDVSALKYWFGADFAHSIYLQVHHLEDNKRKIMHQIIATNDAEIWEQSAHRFQSIYSIEQHKVRDFSQFWKLQAIVVRFVVLIDKRDHEKPFNNTTTSQLVEVLHRVSNVFATAN